MPIVPAAVSQINSLPENSAGSSTLVNRSASPSTSTTSDAAATGAAINGAATVKAQAKFALKSMSNPGSLLIPIFATACLVAFLVLGVLVGLRMKQRRQKRVKPNKEIIPLPTPYVEKILPKEVCSEEYPDLEPVEQGWHVKHSPEHLPRHTGHPGHFNNGGGGGRNEEPWTPPFAPMDILMLPPFGSRAATPLACDDGEEGRFLEGSSRSTPLSPGSDEMTLPPPLDDNITISYSNNDEPQQQYYYHDDQQGEEEGQQQVNRSKHRFSRRRRSNRTRFSPAESPQPSPGLPAVEEPVVEADLLKRRERRRMRKSKKQTEHLMVPQRYAKQETTDLARRRLAMACNSDSDSNSDALIR